MEKKTNDNLVARYIYAVEQELPRKMRGDIKRELETLISDMLEERCGDMPPTEKDIRAVLLELGTPSELAAKYDNDKFGALISGSYYRIYKKVLKIVLVATAFGIILASAIAGVVETPTPISVLISTGSFVSGLFTAAAIVTLLFVIFERKGVVLNTREDSINSLPPLPDDKTEISLVDPIIGMVMSVAFTALFLIAPDWFVLHIPESGIYYVPAFDTALIRELTGVFIVMCLAGVANEIVRLIERKHNFVVAVACIVSDLVTIYGASMIFMQNHIFTDEIGIAICQVTGMTLDTLPGVVFGMINEILFFVITFGCALDIICALVRAIKNRGR